MSNEKWVHVLQMQIRHSAMIPETSVYEVTHMGDLLQNARIQKSLCVELKVIDAYSPNKRTYQFLFSFWTRNTKRIACPLLTRPNKTLVE